MIEWMDNASVNPYGLMYAKRWIDISFKFPDHEEYQKICKDTIYKRLVHDGDIRRDFAYEYVYNGGF
jgi:hypothetical protein